MKEIFDSVYNAPAEDVIRAVNEMILGGLVAVLVVAVIIFIIFKFILK